ncbi:hypothetical protein B1757_02580 [Acidithiobacillus marinus]|uniref:Uncharacterized protein n=1 Tax=Acidithiobacillus marinus TaxID=187490 RepID=A0A2I1DPM6_9PROT|nr:hypothetical protein [Acidithiobacillus marinus]PKY11864.1 hypothetical protein B1757_02580 [Acidithiobacillus marinus]
MEKNLWIDGKDMTKHDVIFGPSRFGMSDKVGLCVIDKSMAGDGVVVVDVLCDRDKGRSKNDE